ncbi:MAG: ABC transporter substrate-binding protein [Coriobacteriales bacterium]|jgi:putative spermidine/putrescine transport system substrate-binding protein|nr:ABC transporter substrate-binding protein [Coriobacteriales bacterium]
MTKDGLSRRRFVALGAVAGASLLTGGILAGCGNGSTGGSAPGGNGGAEVDLNDFNACLEAARGTTVNWYQWGGDERINNWVHTAVADYLLANHEITINLVPQDDTVAVITKLLDEKSQGIETGSVDLIWVNGENFLTAKENGLFTGPITEGLPNYDAYVDSSSDLNNYDFGVPVEGLETPYARAIFVFINDAALTPEAPKNTAELLEYAKKYPGKVSYPAPPDFTGSVFVRQIAYDIVGYEALAAAGTDKEALRTALGPAIDYLNELKPYLWNEGKSYPASSGQQENMFADGELVLHMAYDPNTVASLIEQGTLPDSCRDFAFDSGMIGNTSFLAMPINAPNKPGTIVAINALLSPELQASKEDISNWGAANVLEYDRLDASQKELFDRLPQGIGAIPAKELAPTMQPELVAGAVPLIEEIWIEDVAQQ